MSSKVLRGPEQRRPTAAGRSLGLAFSLLERRTRKMTFATSWMMRELLGLPHA